MPKAQAIVPSASGYPIYSRLNNPIFARDLVERFQHDGVTAQFTTSQLQNQFAATATGPIQACWIGTTFEAKRRRALQLEQPCGAANGQGIKGSGFDE